MVDSEDEIAQKDLLGRKPDVDEAGTESDNVSDDAAGSEDEKEALDSVAFIATGIVWR